ncbi:MAG: ATP-dependent DNA ligase [Clostridia bacterium]|nr:ATP-dependent DNA ligase [Clostridia bacterium]
MDWIQPMEPILTSGVQTGPEFVHQVKWDGIRGMCYVEDGAARVFTKKGRERTPFYPELSELPLMLKGKSAVFDGEIIVLNDELKPTFQLSLMRERVTDVKKIPYYMKKYPARYILFDMLALDGRLLTDKPLHERLQLLREHIQPSSAITITDNFDNGCELFDLMKLKGWEGIVSKRKASLYQGGKDHEDWFKTKLSRKILAIAAGVTLKDGFPNALILALQGSDSLIYIGRASIGLTQEHFRLLKESAPSLKAEGHPFIPVEQNSDFTDQPLLKANAHELKDVVWFKPRLTVWVSFLEWTSDGGLRHPKITGFSPLGPEEATGKEYVE